MEGYSHREIAEQLQLSEGTSKWLLSESRKNLKKLVVIYRLRIQIWTNNLKTLKQQQWDTMQYILDREVAWK